MIGSGNLGGYFKPLSQNGFDDVFCVQDFIYHLLAVTFYLSASVILAYVTIGMKIATSVIYPFRYYQIDIAAVVSTKYTHFVVIC